jgi:cardiolipin synthase
VKSFIPLFLTGVRLLAPLFLLVAAHHPFWLMLIFLIASVTDFLDGFLARRWSCETTWGAILDPLADKVLLCTALGILVGHHQLSLSLFLIVFIRDVLLCVGANLLYKAGLPLFKPSWIGKLHTALLMLVCFLGFWAVFSPASSVSLFISILTKSIWVTTIWSGTFYIVKGIRSLTAMS